MGLAGVDVAGAAAVEGVAVWSRLVIATFQEERHRVHTTVKVLFTVSVTVTIAEHASEPAAFACPAGAPPPDPPAAAPVCVAGRTVTVSVTGIQSVIVVVGSAELTAWALTFAIPDSAPAAGAEGAGTLPPRGVEA